ncbi:MAG: type IX secretion system outer membrane channel protein PorV [Flavobacteriales bacterium]|nr:type IX secretion system outer membrane channel protein PorV [Flavobacteriales bacterium]
MLKFRTAAAIFSLFALFAVNAKAQTFQSGSGKNGDLQLNTITTAVPFLMIAPDARSGAMGEVGAATDPDGASIHWNPSKMAFIDNKMGFSLSYTPWLRALVPDINLAYLSGYGKIGKKGMQTLSGSLRYFSLGNITFTDNNGNTIGNFNPNEFAIDLSYARKLSKEFSGGISLRYIYSNLTGGINVGGANTRPGMAGAADISFTYKTERVKIAGKKTQITAGLNISNIGSKMRYTQTAQEDFLPINFRFGVGFKYWIDDRNTIGVFYDINKLMVPTPPKIDNNPYIDGSLPPGDSIGQIGNPANANPNYGNIIAGKNPNVSVPAGMFQSFADAPGGSAEELREINMAVGMEYWYNKLFAIRAGYFYENWTKGNRQFFTVGAGIRYNVFGLDFAYLIPTKQQNPLQNTLRFTLTFDFEAFRKQNKERDEKPE